MCDSIESVVGRKEHQRLLAVRSRSVTAIAIELFSLFSAAALSAQVPVPNLSDERISKAAYQETLGTLTPTSQAESQSCKGGAKKKPNAASEDTADKSKQTSRLMWLLPNFAAVSANTQLPPLSAKGKFWLATKDSFDYSSFAWAGILSAQEYGLNDYPEFGRGMTAYGRYYWHVLVDGISGNYFTQAIVPWATREDPRYYTLGHGNFLRRAGYALSRIVVTKTDSGDKSFNWSQVAGNGLEAGLSNAYYPPQLRSWRQTGINWGAQVETVALTNIATEFWPDIRRVIFRRK